MADYAARSTYHEKLLILVGLTGTGKTTTVNALRDQGCEFRLLPNRRELTDDLIIAPLQEMDGERVTAVTDRTQRFAYTQRYRDLYSGGMAEAVEQWLSVNGDQLSVDPNRSPNAVYRLLIFDGLRGKNEITYAAQNLPEAWFLFLDAPDFVRLQRLLRRNDVFDQVNSAKSTHPRSDRIELDPGLTNWLDDQQLAKLKYYTDQGELTIEDVHAKLTIVQKERQNYDPEATLAALRQHAPDRLIYADTAKQSPEEIAQQVLMAFPSVEWPPRKVMCAGAVVLHDAKVLLIRQAAGHDLAGQWSIPWGIVEADEQPEITAVRETSEEGGITCEIEGFLGYQNFDWESMVAFIYLCTHVNGEPTPDGIETDRAGYFSLAEFEALTDPIEPWANWLIRRVFSNEYHLIPSHSENPEKPLGAFF